MNLNPSLFLRSSRLVSFRVPRLKSSDPFSSSHRDVDGAHVACTMRTGRIRKLISDGHQHDDADRLLWASSAILSARSQRRHSPLVLGFTGGNA
jgi:hypothetical protein